MLHSKEVYANGLLVCGAYTLVWQWARSLRTRSTPHLWRFLRAAIDLVLGRLPDCALPRTDAVPTQQGRVDALDQGRSMQRFGQKADRACRERPGADNVVGERRHEDNGDKNFQRKQTPLQSKAIQARHLGVYQSAGRIVQSGGVEKLCCRRKRMRMPTQRSNQPGDRETCGRVVVDDRYEVSIWHWNQSFKAPPCARICVCSHATRMLETPAMTIVEGAHAPIPAQCSAAGDLRTILRFARVIPGRAGCRAGRPFAPDRPTTWPASSS